MHWVIQREIYKPANFERLIDALDRSDVAYTVVTIARGASEIDPDVNPDGSVFVCGAIKMAKVSASKAWWPGSFLNTNFDHAVWLKHLGPELLNGDAIISTPAELVLSDERFVRPCADNKAFDGRIFRPDRFEDWKRDHPELLRMPILAASVRKLYREYRLFVIQGEVVTGSLYMQAGQPKQSPELDSETINYVEKVARRWQPAEAFVIDVALVDTGYKVIEFNNINSSGFYASDIERLVHAVNTVFGVPRLS